jgi:hypothetical protein
VAVERKVKEVDVGSVQKCLRDGMHETGCVGEGDALMREISRISRITFVDQRYHKH